MKRTFFTLLFTFLWFISCQNPGVRVVSITDLPETLHQGWNPQRWYFYNTNLDTPLVINREKNINGLATPAILPIANRLILTTFNGFLVSADFFLKDIDRKRFSRGISASPAFARPLVYISSEVGNFGLIAYDLLQKKIIWKQRGAFSKSSPLVTNEWVIHATLQGQVMVLNRLNGKKIWTYMFPQKILQNLAMNDQTIFACSGDGMVGAIDLDTGQELFLEQLPEHVYISPVLTDSALYLADVKGNAFKLDVKTGKIIAQKSLQTPFYQPFSTDGHTFYIMGSNGVLFALDKNLKIKWQLELKGEPSMPIVVTARHLIVATYQKMLYLIERHKPSIAQQWALKRRVVSCTPVNSGLVFVALEYDRLARLSLKKESLQ